MTSFSPTTAQCWILIGLIFVSVRMFAPEISLAQQDLVIRKITQPHVFQMKLWASRRDSLYEKSLEHLDSVSFFDRGIFHRRVNLQQPSTTLNTTTMLVIDGSIFLHPAKRSLVKQASEFYIRSLRNRDQCATLISDGGTRYMQSMTFDQNALLQSLNATPRDTAFTSYDVLDSACKYIDHFLGRKSILLFIDNRSSTSSVSPDEIFERLKYNDIVLNVFALGDDKIDNNLRKLVFLTGGFIHYVHDEAEMNVAMEVARKDMLDPMYLLDIGFSYCGYDTSRLIQIDWISNVSRQRTDTTLSIHFSGRSANAYYTVPTSIKLGSPFMTTVSFDTIPHDFILMDYSICIQNDRPYAKASHCIPMGMLANQSVWVEPNDDSTLIVRGKNLFFSVDEWRHDRNAYQIAFSTSPNYPPPGINTIFQFIRCPSYYSSHSYFMYNTCLIHTFSYGRTDGNSWGTATMKLCDCEKTFDVDVKITNEKVLQGKARADLFLKNITSPSRIHSLALTLRFDTANIRNPVFAFTPSTITGNTYALLAVSPSRKDVLSIGLKEIDYRKGTPLLSFDFQYTPKAQSFLTYLKVLSSLIIADCCYRSPNDSISIALGSYCDPVLLKKQKKLLVLPNPIGDALTVRAQIEPQREVFVKIFNHLGKEIASIACMSDEKGVLFWSTPFQQLSRGLYLCKILFINKWGTPTTETTTFIH